MDLKKSKKGFTSQVEAEEMVPENSPVSFIAKKDFIINHNGYFKQIKSGDDLSEVPKLYLENLKTENVL